MLYQKVRKNYTEEKKQTEHNSDITYTLELLIREFKIIILFIDE